MIAEWFPFLWLGFCCGILGFILGNMFGFDSGFDMARKAYQFSWFGPSKGHCKLCDEMVADMKAWESFHYNKMPHVPANQCRHAPANPQQQPLKAAGPSTSVVP